MAYLFNLEGNIAKPNTETLLISPFKEIWKRDQSEDKHIALREFTFLELMSSKRKSNPYAGYSDEVRYNKLKEQYFNPDWEMDELLERGLAVIAEFQTDASPTYQYYISSLEAAEKTRNFLKNIDLNEKNFKTGNPLYKPKDVTSAIIDTEKIIQTLALLKEKVEQELFDQVKTKGNKQINLLEM